MTVIEGAMAGAPEATAATQFTRPSFADGGS